MKKFLKELRTGYSRKTTGRQRGYLRGLTKFCGRSCLFSYLAVFEWFDSSVFYLSGSTICACFHEYAAWTRANKVKAALIFLALVEKLFWVALASNLDWDPSLGRWYAIRAFKLSGEAYWLFFARQALVLALAAALACVVNSRRSRSSQDANRISHTGSPWNLFQWRNLIFSINASIMAAWRRAICKQQLCSHTTWAYRSSC